MPTQLQPGQHCPLDNWSIRKQLIVGSAQFHNSLGPVATRNIA
jgi:hypothetical protein